MLVDSFGDVCSSFKRGGGGPSRCVRRKRHRRDLSTHSFPGRMRSGDGRSAGKGSETKGETMPRLPRSTNRTFVLLLGALLLLLLGVDASAAPRHPSLSGQSLAPTTRVQGAKAPTSRLAQTDRSLLGRSGTAPLQVVIK